jgi:regulator of protease activity HflC (stomatin/prohibitin superfamily)
VNRVELKAIDPPKSIIDAMEKQLRAKRAAILTAEGQARGALGPRRPPKRTLIPMRGRNLCSRPRQVLLQQWRELQRSLP